MAMSYLLNMTFLSIIRSLNSNKAHGWDDISIHMEKIYDESIAYPLKIIFETSSKSCIYPDKWKKANIFPLHIKESKVILKNYRPISLLPVCAKCIYILLFTFILNLMIFYLSFSQVFAKVTVVYLSYWQ